MTRPRLPDIFIGLNIVRVLSIIACLLVFSSSLVTMVHDVEAVNNLIATEKSNATLAASLLDCDYVAYVPPHPSSVWSHTNPQPLSSFRDSTVPNQAAGEFWAVLNRLLITLQVVALILSEIGWPLAFFNRFFPVLGSEFGLGPLGAMECL